MVLKLSYFDLLIIILRASINMTFNLLARALSFCIIREHKMPRFYIFIKKIENIKRLIYFFILFHI